ncbi:MAG: U32 family peptidase, partial [Lachnospiraceae bacterium]|nr:U32 family peptidase [Lachnospiraceae bacterium]
MGLCTHPCRWEYNNVRYGNIEMSPACGNKAIQKNTYENVPEKERQGRLSENFAAYEPDSQALDDFRAKVGNDDQILTKRQAKMVFGQSEGRLSEKPIAYVPHSQNPSDFRDKVGNSNQILVTGQAKVDSDERSEIVFGQSEGENCLPEELAITYGEKGRPGEEFSAIENERGTFLFHSKDLCMIRHLPELVEAGISSLKIEGRNKNQLYVAQCARAYRIALDTYFRLGCGMKHFAESHSQSEAQSGESSISPFDLSSSEEYGKVIAECEKQLIECAARPFSTGFYFGSPDQESQIYEDAPVSRVAFLGEIIGTAFLPDNPRQIEVVFYQKNKFGVGDEIFVVCPGGDLPCRVEA